MLQRKKKKNNLYATIIQIETRYHPLRAADIGLMYHMAQNLDA